MNVAATPKINLRHIARHFAITPGTVSRALAGRVGVSSEVATQIQEYAREHGYAPSPYHRRRSDSIALVFAPNAQADRQFCQKVIYAAERHACQLEKFLMVCHCEANALALPHVITARRVDGALLACHPPRELVAAIQATGIPVTVIDDSAMRVNCDCVNGNPAAGSEELVKRLLAVGHQKFHLAISNRAWPSIDRRFTAITQTLAANGVAGERITLTEGLAPTMEGGYEMIRRLFSADKKTPLPDALIIANDWMALGAVVELARRGVSIPRDLSVAGFDNCDFGAEMHPQLTSVDLRVDDVVARALNHLLDLLDNPSRQASQESMQIEVPSALVWRESTRE